MSLQAWLVFAVTETVLCLTPGPAVLLVLSTGLTRGRRHAMQASIGVLAGNLFYFALSATSLGVVLLASWELFAVVRWLGAAYLIWAGLQPFLARGAGDTVQGAAPAPARPPERGARAFLRGLVVQCANPKALLYFIALLPQFIDPRAPVVPQMALLAATSVVIEFVVLAAYGALAARAEAAARRPALLRLAHRLGGGLLIAAGAGLATLGRP